MWSLGLNQHSEATLAAASLINKQTHHCTNNSHPDWASETLQQLDLPTDDNLSSFSMPGIIITIQHSMYIPRFIYFQVIYIKLRTLELVGIRINEGKN